MCWRPDHHRCSRGDISAVGVLSGDVCAFLPASLLRRLHPERPISSLTGSKVCSATLPLHYPPSFLRRLETADRQFPCNCRPYTAGEYSQGGRLLQASQ